MTVTLLPAPDSRPVLEPRRWRPPPAQQSLFDERDGPVTGTPEPLRREATRFVRLPGAQPPSATLPDPIGWARTLTPALVEVLQRRRPLGQLERWVDEPLLGALAVGLTLRRRAKVPLPPRADVRSVRAQCSRPEVVEVSAVLTQPERVSALAYRLVGSRSGHWLCVALDLGDAALLGQRP